MVHNPQQSRMPDHSATPNSPQFSNSVGQSKLVLLLGIYVLLGGVTSFTGWAADIPRLTDWDNTGISIQPNATVAVTTAGAALLCGFDSHLRHHSFNNLQQASLESELSQRSKVRCAHCFSPNC